jgi:hypothetical protein
LIDPFLPLSVIHSSQLVAGTPVIFGANLENFFLQN